MPIKMKSMKSTTKMSSEERRAAIIRAVRRVFAEKGFDGTTTRELADAAEVSEALLFKHFPNKEALFSAMQLSCCTVRDHDRMERLKALEPSASTLVLMVHFLVSRIITGSGSGSTDEEQAIQNRLFLRSLAEDGEFSRTLLKRPTIAWIPKVEQCLKAATSAGEAVASPVGPKLRAWFTHHLAAIIMFYLLPEEPAVDYGASRAKLVEPAVWFSLRGMGLTDEAIKRYYNPKALALFEN
jgi:AcrR family transcriptional regulator